MKPRFNPYAALLLQSPASRATRLIAATALSLSLAPAAMAASQTWDGNGASTTTPGTGTALNTAANWNGALPSGDGSSMIFESTSNLSLSASGSGFGNSSTVQFNLQQNGTGTLTLDSSYATTSGNSFRFDQINLDGDAGNLTFGNGSGTAFNFVLGKNQATAPAPVLHTWTNSNAASTVTFETEVGFTLGPSSQGRILTLAGGGNWNFKNNIPTSSALLSFTKTGAGTATFSGANTFTGDTKITGGTIILGNALALQNSAWDTTGAGSGVGLNVTGYTTPTLGGLNGSVDLATAVTAGYSSVTNLTLNPQTGISATYSGVIANGASGMTLTKTGVGTQTLSGTNTYTGATTISTGILSIVSTNSLPGWATNGSYTVASGATLGVGNAVTDDNVATILGTTNFASGSSIGFDTTTGDRTYSVVLADGSGPSVRGLTKIGANALVLSSPNTYTGATTISGGTLVVGHVSALSAAMTGSNGTTLRLATDTSVDTFTVSSSSGSSMTIVSDRATSGVGITHALGALTPGSGTASITFEQGSNVTGGTAAVSFASLSQGGSAASQFTLNPTTATVTIGTATTTGSSGRTLVLGGTIAGNAITGAISNGSSTMSLTKSGASTWTLSGDNTYSGTTSVNAGALIVNGTHSGAGAVSVASGAKLGGSGTLAASTTISGILAPGNSIDTLTIQNDVTWQGAATVGSSTNWQYELGVSNTSDLLNITGASSEFLKNTSVGSFFNFDFLESTSTGTFTLVDWESTVDLAGGAFGTNFLLSDFSYTNLGGGNTGTFSFNDTSLQFSVVPEPRAALIGGLGLLMLFRRRRFNLA